MAEGRSSARSVASGTFMRPWRGIDTTLSAPMAHSEGPPDSGTAAGDIQPVVFGNYLLERRLAVGGTSQVFLARRREGSQRTERLVIKRLLPSLLTDVQALGMF